MKPGPSNSGAALERTKILSRAPQPETGATAFRRAGEGDASIAPGTQLNGIYEVESLLATGGMGEVYRARVVETGDLVAVKVIKADLTENEDVLGLFRKEASALHQLYHEAIVRYFVFSKDAIIGRSYLAMEFVEGEAISNILKRGPLDPDNVLKLARRMALGLQAAHERGIIHRDVSPDNIIIQSNDVERAKIIDFGIARSTNTNAHTIIGAGFAGKYNYVSPEQLGLFGADVTAQSDIYSLGLVLAEASGHGIDMNGSMVEIIEKRRRVPDLSAFEPRLRFLLEKMLQPQPADRPDSMLTIADYVTHELGITLKPRVSKGLERPVSPPPGRQKKPKPARTARPSRPFLTRPVVIGLATSLCIVLAGGAYFWFSTPTVIPQLPPSAELHPSDSDTAGKPQKNDGADNTSEKPKTQDSKTQDSKTDESVRPPVGNTHEADLKPDSSESSQGTVLPSGATDRDRIISFVKDFPTGPCTAVTGVTAQDKSASVTGFGLSEEPFDKLDAAFRKTLGFEADIAVRVVANAQCPVLSFLKSVAPDDALAPRLEINSPDLRSGQMLTGSVSVSSDRQIQVLIVDNDGTVQKTPNVVRTGGLGAFNMTIRKALGASAGPQLVVAITSQHPLPSLQASALTSRTDQLFKNIEAEAKQSGDNLGVALGYFQLE